MRTHAWILSAGLGLLVGSTSSAAEDPWRVKYGGTLEGRLADVYGAVAFIVGPKVGALVPVDRLDADGISRVGDFLTARDRTPAATWSNSDSPVLRSLRGRMQVLVNDKLVNFEPGDKAEPTFILVYFSAHWCAPCRQYTPRLVEAYRQMKQQHPDLFELVFVSSDESASAQTKYVKEVGMPWVVARYSNLGSLRPVTRFAGDGIPCLVLLGRDGEQIAHSYQGTEYVGPEAVWQRFENLVAGMDPKDPGLRRIMHPVEVRRHVAAAAGGARDPRPYLLVTDRSAQVDAAVAMLTVMAEVDATGRVTAVTTDPTLPAVEAYQFSREAENWLFLPAVSDGQPLASSVRFVLKQ